jgi:molybdate transport system substrate-binding protein
MKRVQSVAPSWPGKEADERALGHVRRGGSLHAAKPLRRIRTFACFVMTVGSRGEPAIQLNSLPENRRWRPEGRRRYYAAPEDGDTDARLGGRERRNANATKPIRRDFDSWMVAGLRAYLAETPKSGMDGAPTRLKSGGNAVRAVELQILAGGGIAAPIKEIAANFANLAGHKLVIRYGTTPELINMATNTPFDLGVVPQDVMKDVAARAHFSPGPALGVARIGIGVAVLAGSPKPDINTPEALKQTLLKAQSIASIPASATGTQLAGIYERLGIAEAMKIKTKAQPGPAQIVEAVVNGDADLAVFLLNVISDPRLDVIGPFPSEIQREVVYVSAVAASSREPHAAKAFISYLISPAGAAVIQAKGMNPG